MEIRFTHSQKVHDAATEAFLRLHPRGRLYMDGRRGNAWWAFSSAILVGTTLSLIEPLLGLLAFGSGLASALGMLWTTRRRRIVEELVEGAEEAPDRLRWFRATVELRVEDAGVHYQTEHLQELIPWTEVEQIVATDHVLVIYGGLSGPLCVDADQMPGYTGIGPLWRALEPHLDSAKLVRA